MYTGNDRFSGNDRHSGLRGPDRFFRQIRRLLYCIKTGNYIFCKYVYTVGDIMRSTSQGEWYWPLLYRPSNRFQLQLSALQHHGHRPRHIRHVPTQVQVLTGSTGLLDSTCLRESPVFTSPLFWPTNFTSSSIFSSPSLPKVMLIDFSKWVKVNLFNCYYLYLVSFL